MSNSFPTLSITQKKDEKFFLVCACEADQDSFIPFTLTFSNCSNCFLVRPYDKAKDQLPIDEFPGKPLGNKVKKKKILFAS